jgi:hypothetical protein
MTSNSTTDQFTISKHTLLIFCKFGHEQGLRNLIIHPSIKNLNNKIYLYNIKRESLNEEKQKLHFGKKFTSYN